MSGFPFTISTSNFSQTQTTTVVLRFFGSDNTEISQTTFNFEPSQFGESSDSALSLLIYLTVLQGVSIMVWCILLERLSLHLMAAILGMSAVKSV